MRGAPRGAAVVSLLRGVIKKKGGGRDAEKSKVKHLKDSSSFSSFFHSLSWLSYGAAWNVSCRQNV